MAIGVRPGQVWEFVNGSAPVRRARVVRIGARVGDIQYVFLTRLGTGRAMKTTVYRLQNQLAGARLAEDAAVDTDAAQLAAAGTASRPSAVVREPRMSVEDRANAVRRARRLTQHGLGVDAIAECLGVTREIVLVWLAETEGEE